MNGAQQQWKITDLSVCAANRRLLLAWQQLCIDTYQATYLPHFPAADIRRYIREQFCEECLRARLLSAQYKGWIAWQSSQAIGYLLLRPGLAPNHTSDPTQICLDKLYVRQAWQAKGLASQLWQLALAWIKLGTQAQRVWLISWRDNHSALAFYRKRGFYEVGSYPFCLGSRVYDDLLLALDLFDTPQE